MRSFLFVLIALILPITMVLSPASATELHSQRYTLTNGASYYFVDQFGCNGGSASGTALVTRLPDGYLFVHITLNATPNSADITFLQQDSQRLYQSGQVSVVSPPCGTSEGVEPAIGWGNNAYCQQPWFDFGVMSDHFEIFAMSTDQSTQTCTEDADVSVQADEDGTCTIYEAQQPMLVLPTCLGLLGARSGAPLEQQAVERRTQSKVTQAVGLILK